MGRSSGSPTSSPSGCCSGSSTRAARACAPSAGGATPTFEFPQDAVRRAGWSPRLSDYLYVSFTNAIAVSPTDTMPLTRRAKGLMAVESLISYAVVILVVARAVNVLGASA
jgi:uncharacterized membrane protein